MSYLSVIAQNDVSGYVCFCDLGPLASLQSVKTQCYLPLQPTGTYDIKPDTLNYLNCCHK